ncbi:DHH family phosphoesterase [Paenibacillus sp. y28]|uniref:DHH family phosphoesterase n=1 Tax=Paenibacillus sp. y28 TaxID=3129110 RepID=UPI00301845B0
MSYAGQLQAASRFLEAADDVLVVSHVQPDGDAASSTFAIGLLLKHLGKSYTLINEGSIPGKFDFMPGFTQVVHFKDQKPERLFHHVVAVDCADFGRIGQVSSLFAADVQLLNIDHHPTNDGFGAVNVIKADAASTTEIIFDLCVEMGLRPQGDLAVCLYTGLLTDTGGFRYANTSPKVLQIAADLVSTGVKGHVLAEKLLEKMTLPQVELLRRGLATLSFAHEGRISWVSASLQDREDTGASNEDFEGLVNYPRNIEGVEVGLMFKQTDTATYKVSFRSAGQVDVAAIAQQFGGGGHIRAAGCTVEGQLDEVVERIVLEVGRALG